MKQGLTSDRIPPVFGPYSSAVAAGDMIFISGNAGFDKNQKLVGEGDVKEETRQALLNIKMLLEDNGACLDDIVTSLCGMILMKRMLPSSRNLILRVPVLDVS